MPLNMYANAGYVDAVNTGYRYDKLKIMQYIMPTAMDVQNEQHM